MTQVRTISEILQRMSVVSDWRFALGLHVRFANPTLLYQTYPPEWIKYYNSEGLVFVDPAVRWAIANKGICDWSDLEAVDDHNVLGQAANHGLKFGKIVSVGGPSRSFGFFARPSRTIQDAEIHTAKVLLEELHHITQGAETLPEHELAVLCRASTTLSAGDRRYDLVACGLASIGGLPPRCVY